MPDPEAIKQDFPILSRPMRTGKPVTYLDSGATSQKPAQVIDAMATFQRENNANVHRGVYQLGEEATKAYDEAHSRAARFVNAPDERGLIFTKNCTEALNLLAYTFGLERLEPGDEVIVSMLDHHSNIVPWQAMCRRTGATLKVVPPTKGGAFDVDAYRELLSERTKVVSVTVASNVLGVLTPMDEVVEAAHDVGALVFGDGAQSVPHLPTDVEAMGVDALAWSGHKMLGPNGIGALWCRPDLLEDAEPFLYGGEMIRSVTVEESRWNELPWKFEAGTPPTAEAVGLHAAMDYLDDLGMDWVHEHDQALTRLAVEGLLEAGCEIYGPEDAERCGAVSFNVPGIHPHDLASLMDDQGVAIRAGHHCAQPLMKHLGVAATARASFYVYNTPADVEALLEAISYAKNVMGVSDGGSA